MPLNEPKEKTLHSVLGNVYQQILFCRKTQDEDEAYDRKKHKEVY